MLSLPNSLSSHTSNSHPQAQPGAADINICQGTVPKNPKIIPPPQPDTPSPDIQHPPPKPYAKCQHPHPHTTDLCAPYPDQWHNYYMCQDIKIGWPQCSKSQHQPNLKMILHPKPPLHKTSNPLPTPATNDGVAYLTLIPCHILYMFCLVMLTLSALPMIL